MNIPGIPGIIDSFSGLNVLVIGDAMLDVYLDGSVERVCREAPVAIVDVGSITRSPGGAANTAANIRSMGGHVVFLSVTGDDYEGMLLRAALEAADVPVCDLVTERGRATLAKNRVVAGSQIVMRFAQGGTSPIDRESEREVTRRLSAIFPTVDAVLVSDYGYGVLTPPVIDHLGRLQAANPRTLVVDSKHLLGYRSCNVTSVKPNNDETLRLVGLPPNATPEDICAHGDRILHLTGARIAAVTLDAQGALFFEEGGTPYRTHAHPAHKARATGAGDTFASAMTLTLALGENAAAAAEIASAAAAVVVSKEGTTTCSARELREYFRLDGKCLGGLGQLAERVASHRKRGMRIAFTNGCFDIIHRGHVDYLSSAKALADVLIVGVNSDPSVRRLKGPGRPINGLRDRVRVLAALSSVDHVIAFDEDTPAEVIKVVRPDVFIKGGDYTSETLPEAPLVRDLGGRVEILPYSEEHSTTGIVGRIRGMAGNGQETREGPGRDGDERIGRREAADKAAGP
jgi:D-beta-D-heptose 7-phosphate kinase/D-beta-D-heptose 1-phosphate adenosyltransferase